MLVAWAAGCGQQPGGPAANRDTADEGAPREIATAGGVPMVSVPAGEFIMGDAAGDDTAPAHKVSVGAFSMDKFEVTQELYKRITGKNPSRHLGEKNPVERVRWREAIAFCNARSEAEHLHPCYDIPTGKCDFAADGYRLPTEAEWEYACRGGTSQAYYFGGDAGNLKSYAWFKGNADRTTHPVGQLRPNPFGLCDMAGNVWEWCNDWYEVDYYEKSPADNPRGPDRGEKKSLRGGAFSSKPDNCTSAARNCDDPGFADACVASDDFGFRCVRRR
jgi:formylglycine-generating enzyme required for sulfatase activity